MTFRSPGVWALGNATVTVVDGVCGVAAATCTNEMAVGVTYVNAFGSVALCVSTFVTVTVTTPAACVGVVAVIVVALTTITLVAALPPRLSVAPARKLVPVTVTAVPPVVGPDTGATLVTVGAGNRYVKPGVIVPIWPSV